MSHERLPTVKEVIRALCALRPDGLKAFFRESLEIMSDDQLHQLMQKMGEWLSHHPHRKEKS